MKTLLLCLLLAAISQPTVPLDELQELLAANLDAMEKLHKVLLDHSDTNQPEMTEVIAAATSNAVRELLEQRQRNFEQEEKEAIAQGKLRKPSHKANSRRRNAIQDWRQTILPCWSNTGWFAKPMNISSGSSSRDRASG